MYLRKCSRTRGKKGHVYWELVESYRTERGPRQRVVAYLGDVAETKRLGVQQAAKGIKGSWQSRLFDEEGEAEWVEVDTRRVRVEGVRDFGGLWLGYEVINGNRADVTTVEDIVEKIEGQYGSAGRIWVMDRGMASLGGAFRRLLSTALKHHRLGCRDALAGLHTAH